MSCSRFIEGTRLLNGEVIVTVGGRLLDPFPSQAVRNHSPTGFAWGYGGSGPAQLALAILIDWGCLPALPNGFISPSGGIASAG